METSLHRQLKERYAATGGLVEQRLGRFRIDVIRGHQLIEIQCASLSAIRDKIKTLLAKHEVLVVKPIVIRKHLVKRQREDGEVISRRRSPKQRSLLDVFEELVHFTRVFPHKRLTLEVLLIEIEEWRYPGHGRRRRYRDNDHEVEDQHLVEVHGVHEFRSSKQFHTGHIADGLKVDRWIAQRMAYCLRHTGALKQVGKQGGAWLYEQKRRKAA